MIYYLLFLFSQAVFWVGSMIDLRISKKQVPCGLEEGDLFKLNRDKYGYFSASRFWTVHLIYWAATTGVCLILFAFTDAGEKHFILLFFSFLCFLPAGGASLYRGLRNERMSKTKREKVQIPLLERLAQITPYDEEAVRQVFASTNAFWQRRTNGRVRCVWFSWLYMDDATDEQFQYAFFKAIWDISQRGRAQWFSDTSMRKLV